MLALLQVNMLIDAVLHGDWPSLPQYCGTVLIAISFVLLVAGQDLETYSTSTFLKSGTRSSAMCDLGL